MGKWINRTAGRIAEDIRRSWLALLLVVVYGVLAQCITGQICPYRIFLGFPCPGCGLTHSCVYILMGRWKEAAQWNITGFLWLPYLSALCLFRYVWGKKMPLQIPLLIVVCIATLIWWVLRWPIG